MFRLVLRLCVVAALVAGLSQDARAPHSGLNDLQYPDDALQANPADIYSLTPGLVPPPRVKGTVTYVEPLVVVMGGYNTDGSFLDDVHVYDTRVRKWSGVLLKRQCCNYEGDVIERMGASEETVATGLNPPRSNEAFEGDLPAARAEHAACSIGGKVYVFGGVSALYGYSNDFYVFDPVAIQWSLIDRYGGQGPTRRAGHSLVTDYDTESIVLFGGRAKLAGRAAVGMADVWIYDTSSRKWEWASAATGHGGEGQQAGPPGRQHSAAAIARSTLFVVGGIDPASQHIFNDVWAFHLGTKQWQQLAASSGQTTGLAPPPLYHSTLLAVPHASGANSTGFDHYDMLLFGGVGGGGACGGASCGQAETALGQVYRLPLSFDPYELDNSESFTNQGPQFQADVNSGTRGVAGVGIDGKAAIADVTSWRLRLHGEEQTTWAYARLSDDSDDVMLHGMPNAEGIPGASGPGGGGALGRGRLLKTWAMEAVAFDQKRSLMYELGGMQAIPMDLVKANQVAKELAGPSLLDTGNEYTGNGNSRGVASDNDNVNAPLWDTHTHEHLRTTTQLPVNGPWVFEDGFERMQPQVNGTLRFLRTFRTYQINASKNIVLQIDDRQGTVP